MSKKGPVPRETCKHQYIVSAWKYNTHMQWASKYICQFCLKAVESDEAEQLNKDTNQDA